MEVVSVDTQPGIQLHSDAMASGLSWLGQLCDPLQAPGKALAVDMGEGGL
jgi:hypothetical protein